MTLEGLQVDVEVIRARVQKIMRDNQEVVVLIRLDDMMLLMGPKGETIREIQKKSGAKLTVDKTNRVRLKVCWVRNCEEK